MKLNLIQENNILIPKDGKRNKQDESKYLMTNEDDFLLNL